MTPDVNVLVAAFLEGHPQRVQAQKWLTGALADCASGATLAILPMVAVGFLRVVTSHRTCSAMNPIEDAIAFLESILSAPGVSMPDVGPEWDAFEALCLERNLRGGIISDAWIASATKATGLHLVTFDADFRRLLLPNQYTLLVPEDNLQEPRVNYLVDYRGNRQVLAA